MKTIRINFLLFQCLLLANINAFSQSIELLDENNLWSVLEEDHSPAGFPEKNPYKLSHWLKTGTDTIVNGKTYKNILYAMDVNHLEWEDRGFLMREEEGKVYCYNQEELREEETLLYDFGLQEGDSISRFLHPQWDSKIISAVDSIRFIQIGNSPRKIFYISNTIDSDDVKRPEIWIEGIGSLWGLQRKNICSFVTGCEITWDLLCFYQNDEKLYHSPYFEDCYYHWISEIQKMEHILDFQIYPNPSSGKFTLKTDDKNGDCKVQILDVNGKQIRTYDMNNLSYLEIDLSNVSSGTYFVKLMKQKFSSTKKIIINTK